MVDETGTIVKYTKPQRLAKNGNLRKNLEETLGKAPLNHQAHHIVSDNVVKNSLIHQEAIKRGLYDIDRSSNGKFLAETADDFTDISKELPTHYGNHPNYDTEIIKKIDDVLRANNFKAQDISKLTDEQIINLLEDIEDLSFEVLENWKPSRLN